ncbi:MAG: hypothetical protein ACOZNI_37055 [Myxococcota bacterium]
MSSTGLPPTPGSRPPTSLLGRWLRHGSEQGAEHAHPTFPWYKVLWLTGVDYFSTLGYQPGIALLAAGALAPLATAVLVIVTLLGAVPMYREVARRSYQGHGSISMLERLMPGWSGKLLMLGLVGFAATAFVITMTLSAADAAQHAVENPYLEPLLHGQRTPLTIALLCLLAVVFLKGFGEAIGIAWIICVPYLALNVVVIGRGLWEIAQHPDAFEGWKQALTLKGDPASLALLALLTFPKLALGLSGFETGVTVLPLVKGDPSDPPDGVPHGRIRNGSKLLLAAALIMSGLLIGSSLVTTILIPPEAWGEGGDASGRALAWMAHHYLGSVFGTVYDASTILILWFAGASAMAALLALIPKYLPRFGMAPHWVSFVRPLILVILAIDILVTVAFDSDVESQGGAYATGVLALFLSAAIAVTLAIRNEAKAERKSTWRAAPFALISAIFAFTLFDNILDRPDGLVISSIFIAAILILGAFSRYKRATEFRVEKIAFENPESQALFETMRGRKVHLVTVKHSDAILHRHRERIRAHYKVEGPFCFVHVDLAKDRSLFDSTVYLRVARLGDDYRVYVSNAVAVANTVAFVSEMLDPKAIFLGLTRENPMAQAFRYLLWGEGETGILVYQILLRYWNWTPEDDVRPNIFLMSD